MAHEYDAITETFIYINHRGKDRVMPTEQNMGAIWKGEGQPCFKEDKEHHTGLEIE